MLLAPGGRDGGKRRAGGVERDGAHRLYMVSGCVHASAGMCARVSGGRFDQRARLASAVACAGETTLLNGVLTGAS